MLSCFILSSFIKRLNIYNCPGNERAKKTSRNSYFLICLFVIYSGLCKLIFVLCLTINRIIYLYISHTMAIFLLN